MVTSIFLFLLIPLASSQEFSLTSPEIVNLNEEFAVTINANDSETYDIKIFVHNPTKEFSEIYDGEKWRSPFTYIKEAFPEQKDFRIISHFEGETQLCARLRKSGETSFKEICNEITINPASSQEQNSNNTNIEEEENIEIPQEQIEENKEEQKEDIKQEINQETKPKLEKQIENLDYQTNSNQTYEKIILNSPKKPLKTNAQQIQAQEIFTTKYEKTRLAIIYGFIAICVLIIILLALRKL